MWWAWLFVMGVVVHRRGQVVCGRGCLQAELSCLWARLFMGVVKVCTALVDNQNF